MNVTTRDYDIVQAAKLIRTHLSETFPGVKFKVTSNRNCSAVDVHWTDGPFLKDVEASVSDFKARSCHVRFLDCHRNRSDAYNGQLAVVAADLVTRQTDYVWHLDNDYPQMRHPGFGGLIPALNGHQLCWYLSQYVAPNA